MQTLYFLTLFLICLVSPLSAVVLTGIDLLFEPEQLKKLQGSKIALVTNQTAINSSMKSTLELLKSHKNSYEIVKLFAPEHGLKGEGWASDHIEDSMDDGIAVLSLHGKTRRPTPDMLKGVDLIIFDIQDIGSRSYTYASTLFYVMEEAAKAKIKVMVLDRPNPINGLTMDGPMMEEKWRSFVGYLNVPYCHGMTLGELALYFNGEYKIGCALEVIPMRGWKRKMTFKDTGLTWIPTSPYIPESDTPLYYPMTGILGELGVVSIGIGYTLPFKVVGAPWIEAERLSQALNKQKIVGVTFRPFYFRPFSGKYAHQNCQGVLIKITDPLKYKPVYIQYVLIDTLKKLYPKPFKEAVKLATASQKAMFSKVNGTEEIYNRLILKEPNVAKYIMNNNERKRFEEIRSKYLLYKD